MLQTYGWEAVCKWQTLCAENTDNASILMRYANGSKAYVKERIEVFAQQRVFIIDNWRKLEGYGVKGFKKMSGTMDKGQKTQFALLNERIKTGGKP